MSSRISTIKATFSTRLDTLEHLLAKAEERLGPADAFLERRLAPDMFPLGTQIAFTCNQPRNFSLWCLGEAPNDLDPAVATVSAARTLIRETKELLSSIAVGDSILSERKIIEFGGGLYAEVPGEAYVNDFLVPNFYFHLVTAYGILRAAGLDIGKRDFMLHLTPFVKQRQAASEG